MKPRSLLFYLLALIGVLALASMVSAMSAVSPTLTGSTGPAYQGTVLPTMPAGVTPPVVVVTGVVPDTGGQDFSSNWFFLTILVVAGLACLVAIAALLRRPYE